MASFLAITEAATGDDISAEGRSTCHYKKINIFIK